MKYISTQRPLVPGAFPKYKDNRVIEIKNFDERTKVFRRTKDGINQIYAWGVIEYAKAISKLDADAYELIPMQEQE